MFRTIVCASVMMLTFTTSHAFANNDNLPPQAQTILAGMIRLMPPGKSVYSRTSLDICDDKCQNTKICELPTLLCAPPAFSQEIFESKLARIVRSELNNFEWMALESKMRLASFTRPETYEEGLKRYAVIAQAIMEIAQDMAWSTGSEICRKECTKLVNAFYRAGLTEKCKKCVKAHPWMGSSRELQAALIAVMYGESGFRQDIHAGIGAFSKGDCQWRDKTTQKRVSAFAKNASPVPGTCRSVCLAQINIGSEERWGYRAADLVGTDLASTKRCAYVSARILAASRQKCSGPSSDYKGTDWARAMLSAYGTGGHCRAMTGTGGTLREADWTAKRSAWFWNLIKHPADLDEKAKTVLGFSSSDR